MPKVAPNIDLVQFMGVENRRFSEKIEFILAHRRSQKPAGRPILEPTGPNYRPTASLQTQTPDPQPICRPIQ